MGRFNQNGFSLLEFIVTLVLVAIVGAMAVSFMGTKMTQGGRTVAWMRDEFELSRVMERMLADYRAELSAGTLDLAAFIGGRDTAVEINALYGSSIDDVQAAATAFQPDPAPSDDYTEAGADGAVQKVTLKKGEQTLVTLFTE